MTAQGSPLTRYRRALERRSIFGAELAAREAGHLPLPDALGLVALYAAEESPKFEAAAVRWLARLALEKRGLTLCDVHLAASALAALPERANVGTNVLTELMRQRENWASARDTSV